MQAKAANTPILDLFEIGKGKKNRATEVIFLERCLNLLAPGGRMGIVLPDGNLNNPSLTWLRRWAEGRAKLMAVVSLPEETFRSSNATVKASLLFLRRFTAADAVAWEAAWTQAHGELDAGFNAQRQALHVNFSPRLTYGNNKELVELLDKLAGFGMRRLLPTFRQGDPPPYPRGIGPTLAVKPAWVGEVKEATRRKEAAGLKRQCQELVRAQQEKTDRLFTELKAKLRAVDDAHTAALWKRVRELFDYPVFVAAPKSVGISSTGDTGENVPNTLPQVLEAYQNFEKWLEAGGDELQPPRFS